MILGVAPARPCSVWKLLLKPLDCFLRNDRNFAEATSPAVALEQSKLSGLPRHSLPRPLLAGGGCAGDLAIPMDLVAVGTAHQVRELTDAGDIGCKYERACGIAIACE